MRGIPIAILIAATGCASAGPPPAERVSFVLDPGARARRLEIVRPTSGTGHVAILLEAPHPLTACPREAAHLLEHLVLRTRSGEFTVAEHFDQAGGSVHGRTAPGGVSFHGFAPEPEIDRLAGVLLAAVRVPVLEPGEIEKERRILAIETGRTTEAGPSEVAAIHALLVEGSPPVVAVLASRGTTPPPAWAGRRAEDPDRLADDLAAGAASGDLLTILERWPGETEGGPDGAWSWTVDRAAGAPLPLLGPEPVSVPPRSGPALVLRVPVRGDGPSERKALVRELYRELVFDRGIAYGPTVVLCGDELRATVWTDASGLAECARLLLRKGRVEEVPGGLAPASRDW